MSKSVLLLRHGKADWAEAGGTDHDRPLTSRGRQDLTKLGHRLLERGLVIDCIVTSTAVRTYSTAALLASVIGYDLDKIRLDKSLYLAGPDGYVRALIDASLREPERARFKSILLVGHNPGLSELASAWTREAVDLPTAALAHLEVATDAWSQIQASDSARLLEMFIPREA